RLVYIPLKGIIKTFKVNFPIFSNQFFPNLYNTATTFFLGIFVGNYWVGLYDAVKKVVDILNISLSILSRVFFPFLNRKKNAFKYYLKMSLSISIFLTILPIVFHQQILKLLN